jgi:hypothetical protein
MTTGATQLPLGLTSHNNQSLFSDHYLDDILRRSDAWREAIPQAEAFLVWLRDLYAAEKAQLSHYNKDKLEDKWFKPIFDRLGHTEWELFLADAQQQHQQLTAQFIALETELNQHVYALFHLTPEEIQIIETSTKYNYGGV